MSQNVYDVLQERGFIAQTTHEELRELLGKEKVTEILKADVEKAIAHVESLTGKKFDDPKNPLLGRCLWQLWNPRRRHLRR